MTNRTLARLFAALTIFAGAAPLTAQDQPADSIREVRLVDGSTMYGTLIDDGDPIVLRLLSGDEIRIARARVREIRAAQGTIRDGEIWRQDPNLTRLFFSPTARTMPKGSGYIAAYEAVFPFVAVALTDDLLFAGGTHLFGSLFDDRMVYFAPKLRLYGNGRTDVAVGGFFFEEIDGSSTRFGALYGAITQGTPDAAVTLAAGAAYDDNGFLDAPVAMLGGEVRVARTIKLVSENYLASEAQLFTAGVRFFGDRISADLGIGAILEDSEFYTLPIVNFVYVW